MSYEYLHYIEISNVCIGGEPVLSFGEEIRDVLELKDYKELQTLLTPQERDALIDARVKVYLRSMYGDVLDEYEEDEDEDLTWDWNSVGGPKSI